MAFFAIVAMMGISACCYGWTKIKCSCAFSSVWIYFEALKSGHKRMEMKYCRSKNGKNCPNFCLHPSFVSPFEK
jgi:hypothetical protein